MTLINNYDDDTGNELTLIIIMVIAIMINLLFNFYLNSV